MSTIVGLRSSPLFIGAIAALLGCGDATLVGVSSPPPPPEAQRVGWTVPFARPGCSSSFGSVDPRALGSRGGTASPDPKPLGGLSGEDPSRANVPAAALSQPESRMQLRLETIGVPTPAPLATSRAPCSLFRRSNYAVAW